MSAFQTSQPVTFSPIVRYDEVSILYEVDVLHETELFHATRLPSGVMVLTETMPGVETVAVGVWSDAGSADEGDNEHGHGHMLEHMFFKGTGRRTAYDLAEEIENIGGQLNAYTEREITHLYARALAEHLPLAFDLLADMVCHSAFPQDEMDRECQVIIEEIRKYEAMPEERIHDSFMAGLWHGGRLGHSILGSEESVRRSTRDDVVACWRRHFATNRVVISAVGKVEHAQIVEMSARAFAALPVPTNGVPSLAMGTRLPRVVEEEDCEQVNFCWGGRSYPAHDDRNFALAILDAIFGASTTSRLFQEIREKRGLAYDVVSETEGFRDTGLICAGGATSVETFPEVLGLIRGEIAALRAQGVTAKELARAKEQIKAGLALALESTLDRMRRLAIHYFTWGQVFSIRYLIDRLNAVSLDDVMQVIDEVMDVSHWTFAAIGPVTDARVAELLNE